MRTYDRILLSSNVNPGSSGIKRRIYAYAYICMFSPIHISSHSMVKATNQLLRLQFSTMDVAHNLKK
ncbi:unnamed protein product [Trichobilharzia szidati]|nr:unnamed protein product [Trichobilharzia szidati]